MLKHKVNKTTKIIFIVMEMLTTKKTIFSFSPLVAIGWYEKWTQDEKRKTKEKNEFSRPIFFLFFFFRWKLTKIFVFWCDCLRICICLHGRSLHYVPTNTYEWTTKRWALFRINPTLYDVEHGHINDVCNLERNYLRVYHMSASLAIEQLFQLDYYYGWVEWIVCMCVCVCQKQCLRCRNRYDEFLRLGKAQIDSK